MKRSFEDNRMSRDYSPSKRTRSSEMEIRFLIPSKSAGSIIGKGGSTISRLRSEYPATISIPDCPGPERILCISGSESSVTKLVEEVLTALDEGASVKGEADVRILVHQSQAGAVIGKGGSKVKELREESGGTVKVFGSTCPQSTDRVVQITGDRDSAATCVVSVLEILKDCPVKGMENPYNPFNCDEMFAHEYGGWSDNKSGGGRFNPMGGRGPMNSPMGGGFMGGNRGGGMSPGGFGGGMSPFGGGDRRRGPAPFQSRGHRDDYDDEMMHGGRGGGRNFMNGGGQSLMGGNNHEQTSTQVTIPKDAAGAIIGKAGQRIRRIRAESGCAISIEDTREGSDDRIITIGGTEQQIKHAQYLLQQSVREYGGANAGSGRRSNY